ncbi:hypothetical protein GQ457_03G001290 [Hibiscus cannabinus]
MAWAPRIGPNRVLARIWIRVVNRITQFDLNQKGNPLFSSFHLASSPDKAKSLSSQNLAAQHLRRRYSIANSGDHSDHVRTSTEPPRRPLPFYQLSFPRRSPELGENRFETLASSSSDLLRTPSDRNKNEICRPPIPSLPSGRWDPWAEPPFAGERSVRNG